MNSTIGTDIRSARSQREAIVDGVYSLNSALLLNSTTEEMLATQAVKYKRVFLLISGKKLPGHKSFKITTRTYP
jgi:hypothetical protein